MSKAKNHEAKKERRIINFLRDLTHEYNKTKFREIDGKMWPYAVPYRNFVDDYKNGKINVIEEPRLNGQRQYTIKEAGGEAENSQAVPIVGNDVNSPSN